MKLERFKQACFVDGVPDEGSGTAPLRAISWKLLLNYLPLERAQWPSFLEEQRASYQAFCVELTTDPHKAARDAGGAGGAGGGGASLDEVDDDPLTADAGSKWAEWHADEELRQEIKKDVDRTLPDYSFYNREQPMGRLHATAISRILFVYAKLNPGIRYVQVRPPPPPPPPRQGPPLLRRPRTPTRPTAPARRRPDAPPASRRAGARAHSTRPRGDLVAAVPRRRV